MEEESLSLFNRRDFLTALAAVGTAAAVGSLIKLPRDTLLSVQENVLHSGYSYQYPEDGYVASTCLQCPAGCGIAVRVVSGRAVKIEGNPLHPINRGSICPKAHYGLQIVYDPDRVKGPMVMAAVVLPAMWVKRVLIVVPGLLNELRLPTVQSATPYYIPTLTEVLLTLGSFAGLALVVFVFTKLFPPVPAWEIGGVRKLATRPPSIFSLKSVFLAWVVGLMMSAGFVFAWSVATIAVSGEHALYIYAVRPQELQVFSTPLMTNTPMLNLLAIVVLSGLAVLFFRKIFHRR
jgi:hypothetical protein